MNDEHLSAAPDADELASAYLDGELAPEARARAAADPAVMDRIAAFRRVAEEVGAPVTPLAGHRREVMLRHALEAFDVATAPVAGAAAVGVPDEDDAATRTGDASVAPLDRGRRSRRILRVLAPVAAAAAAVAAVAFLARDDNRDDGTAADEPAEVSVAAGAGTVELATVAADETAAPAAGELEAPAADVAEESAATEAAADAGAPPQDAVTAGGATETTAPASASGLAEQVPALAAAADSVPDFGAASTPAEVAVLLAGVSRRTPAPDNAAAVHTALGDCAGLAAVPVASISYQGERMLLVPRSEATYVVVALDCRIVAEVTVEP